MKQVLIIATLAFTFASPAKADGPLQRLRHDAYIGAGLKAKTVCSGVFIAGRNINDVIAQDVAAVDDRMDRISVSINRSSQCITTRVLPLRPIVRQACYVQGLGCVLDGPRYAPPVMQRSPSEDNLGPLVQDLGTRGISAAKLQQAVDFAMQRRLNTRGLLVVYRGEVIAERYGAGFDASTPQLGWSMAKSMTHALVGIGVNEGWLDVNADHLAPDMWSNQDPRSRITLHQLMTMTSGLSFAEQYDNTYSSVVQMLFASQDMGRYAAIHQLSYRPGSKFQYSSGSINLAARVIRDKLGAAASHNWVRQKLLEPLGMQNATFEIDGSGTFVGSSYVYATPRDWARFGQLYLHDGVVDGVRILPAGWAAYAGTANAQAPNGEYGAGFWTNGRASAAAAARPWPHMPADAYAANGHDGQHVMIIPSADLVIVRLGLTVPESLWDVDEFGRQVLAALPQ